MSKDFTTPLFTALLSSGLFLLVFGAGLGFIFLFLPTLPIFALGMSRQPRHTLNAVLLAAALIAVAAGPPSAVLFLLFLGLPAWYIARQSLHWRASGENRVWFPIGLSFVNLALWACITIASITLWYASEPGGLPKMLAENIHDAFSGLPDEYHDIVDALAGDWSFLVFSLTVWMWGLALYAHGWLAHKALVAKQLAQRPDFKLDVFPMPDWMLPLLGICALASLIGSPSMSFLGKSTFISLLLPYFFLGAALLHHASATWPSRRFLLFFIYFLLFAQFWPALVIAGLGLWHHIKHLSTAKTSSKS